MTYVASRFGQDAPARIAASASSLLEASAFIPAEPQVPALIPFYPGGVVTGDNPSGSTGDTTQSWERQPDRLDISFRQGDDVLIPLYLQDTSQPDLDMSTWEWHAQIRRWPIYTSTLINEFTTDASYYPPGTFDDTLGTTLVQLFLPRELNDFRGYYVWEMYSISPYDFANFPQPVDWPEDEVWPPVTGLRTWLWGLCTVRARITDTDVLPEPPDETVPVPVAWNGGWFVGPNGRVP